MLIISVANRGEHTRNRRGEGRDPVVVAMGCGWGCDGDSDEEYGKGSQPGGVQEDFLEEGIRPGPGREDK